MLRRVSGRMTVECSVRDEQLFPLQIAEDTAAWASGGALGHVETPAVQAGRIQKVKKEWEGVKIERVTGWEVDRVHSIS